MKVHTIGAFFNQTMEFSKHPVATARAQHSLSSGGGEKRECATNPQCVYILGSFFLQDFLVRFSQVRFSQARFSQVRSSQLQLRQVGLGQVRLDQVQLQYKLDILFLPEEERRECVYIFGSFFLFSIQEFSSQVARSLTFESIFKGYFLFKPFKLKNQRSFDTLLSSMDFLLIFGLSCIRRPLCSTFRFENLTHWLYRLLDGQKTSHF